MKLASFGLSLAFVFGYAAWHDKNIWLAMLAGIIFEQARSELRNSI